MNDWSFSSFFFQVMEHSISCRYQWAQIWSFKVQHIWIILNHWTYPMKSFTSGLHHYRPTPGLFGQWCGIWRICPEKQNMFLPRPSCDNLWVKPYTILHHLTPLSEGPSQKATSSDILRPEDPEPPNRFGRFWWAANKGCLGRSSDRPKSCCPGPWWSSPGPWGPQWGTLPAMRLLFHRWMPCIGWLPLLPWISSKGGYRKNVCCAVCERSHETWSRAAGWNGFVGNGVYWVYSKMTIWIGEMMRNHWILGSLIFRQTHMFDSYNYDAWSLRLFGITGQWTSPTWLNFWLQPFFWEIQDKTKTVPQKAKSWLPRRFLPQLSEVILRESLVKTLS